MNEVARQIEHHIPALQCYALSLARNTFAAEDLVQECVVRALGKAHLYRAMPGSSLRAWLFTILHNIHISEVRRAGRWRIAADPEASLAALGAAAVQPEVVMLRAVQKAMLTLPDPQRAVLYAIAVDGDSYEEVSERSGIRVGTVKSRCFRARRALERLLNEACPPEAA